MQPTALDVQIGARMDALRKARGISQERLARELGVSFQQIQKYVRGQNKTSAARLWLIAGLLDVDIAVFFEHAERPAALGPRIRPAKITRSRPRKSRAIVKPQIETDGLED